MKLRAAILLLALGALFFGFAAHAETEAAKEFGAIMKDLQFKSTTLSPDEYVDLSERTLLEFIQKYPKEPEAGKAHFLLGGLYANIGNPKGAVENFQEYLKSPGPKSANELAQAKYFMGSCLLALDRYDEAEKVYRELTSSGSLVDPRITRAASSDLARLATLRKIKVGAPAIEIAALSSQGSKIRLKDYKGKVLLLDFWATWCNPCRMEMPNVIKVYSELHAKGFDIIGISLDTDRAQFDNFIKDNGMTWPQVYDGKGWKAAVAQLYAVSSIPATILIDRQGKIRFKNVRGDELKQDVQLLLTEK